ncbi:host cell division inhibitor Icd-like protein, partial [Serratia marcescens]
PRIVRTVADSEHNARRVLARDYVLSFAGRLPVKAAA